MQPNNEPPKGNSHPSGRGGGQRSKEFDEIVKYVAEEFEATLRVINNVVKILIPLSRFWDRKCRVTCEGDYSWFLY
jgi:hypothetical protein